MALNNKGNSAMSSGSSQLHRSAMINSARGLQALGNISRINPESNPSTAPFSSSYLQQPMPVSNPSFAGLPPPLPPKRNAFMPAYSRYSPISNYFSPFSRYSPGYPGYRMSPYGSLPGSESYNSFTQMAEESTRPAFESIESVVEVVSSISLMLESTYHAVHSSYSAILGVVDQFSRLKDHFAQILSFLSIVRWLRWMCLKVLYLLGARKENPSVDAAWDSAEKMANSAALDVPGDARGSAWPFFMFLGLVVGAPWLMFKLLSKSLAQPKPFNPQAFVDANGKRYVAVAAYDFKATQAGELSFKSGERLMISPKSLRANPRGGWYLACNEKQETGLIPSTYLRNLNRTAARNQPVLRRQPVSGENISVPSEAASETETIDNVDDSVNSAENPVSVLVEKLPDSPENLTDVLVESSVETQNSKPRGSMSSD